jgi:glycosyltransferase involved in cell wall biosynthesis
MNATPSPAPVDPKAVLATLEDLYRNRPTNLPAIAEAGNTALRLGLGEAAREAYRRTVDLLLRIIAIGNADAAMAAELIVYKAFVKAIEDEDHYERAFAQWREPMAALGRKFHRDLAPARAANRVAFVFHSGTLLGHTEVLLRLLESLDRERWEVRVYALTMSEPAFDERFAKLGIPTETYVDNPRWGAKPTGMLARAEWLREVLARDAMPTAVWVSLPVAATFTFAMQVAPVQVFWSLKHHPVSLPEIDGYLTYGSWGEREKVFHGRTWTVCPVPLALDPRPVDVKARAELRAKFPQRVLLGSLAREEKLDSRPYLESVAAILERNPDAGFLWTGRHFHPGIDAFFAQRGLASRTHFVGWVDTALYASALDLFLETFPFGCGITGYQALAAGVPLVSYLEENTVFGMQYWSELMERAGGREGVSRALLEEYPVLCARDPAEYVELASRVLADAPFRDAWKAREARYFEQEIRGIARYTQRFFDAIGAVAAGKLAP